MDPAWSCPREVSGFPGLCPALPGSLRFLPAFSGLFEPWDTAWSSVRLSCFPATVFLDQHPPLVNWKCPLENDDHDSWVPCLIDDSLRVEALWSFISELNESKRANQQGEDLGLIRPPEGSLASSEEFSGDQKLYRISRVLDLSLELWSYHWVTDHMEATWLLRALVFPSIKWGSLSPNPPQSSILCLRWFRSGSLGRTRSFRAFPAEDSKFPFVVFGGQSSCQLETPEGEAKCDFSPESKRYLQH